MTSGAGHRLSALWSLLSPAIITLFAARVALEATARPWTPYAVAAAVVLAAAAAVALATAKARLFARSWFATPLLVYLLWPSRDASVALTVALLAGLTWLLSIERVPKHWPLEAVVDWATFAVFLCAYVATASRDVLPADSGEFQLVAARLGVAHPPGYPLYTIIGHLFIRLLPWGSPAYRLNLLSSLLAAGTAVLISRATRLWARQLIASRLITAFGGVAAALTLGSATTFWAQATVANIRTPTAFCTALAFLAAARYTTAQDPGDKDRSLTLLGVALGFGMGHYPSLGFVAVVLAMYVIISDPRLATQPRRWWRPALAASLGLLPLGYLPIRGAAGAPLAPDNLNTLEGFVYHVTARGFAGDMFAYATVTDLPNRLALLPTLFRFQFNTCLLVCCTLGLVAVLVRKPRLFALLAGSIAVQTFVTITYRAPQTVEYLMPAYLPVAVSVGLLPSALLSQASGMAKPLGSVLRPAVAASVLCAGLLNGSAHAGSFSELARDASTRRMTEPLLKQAPRGALILADLHWVMPLRYLQEVEGIRPDVEIRYVYPIAGQEYRDTWLDRVRAAGTERPLLLTHSFEFTEYTSEPWESGFRLHERPLTEPSFPLSTVNERLGNVVEILGYNLRKGERLHPGDVIECDIAWRPTRQTHSQPSLTVSLESAAGQRVAHADQALPADISEGEVRSERLYLALHPSLAAGEYELTLAAYYTTDAGFEPLGTNDGEIRVLLENLTVQASERVPFTLHRISVPFQSGLELIGVDYDRSVPDWLRVYLHWIGPVGAGTIVSLSDGSAAVAEALLSPSPANAFQTTTVDVPGEISDTLSLSLRGSSNRATGASIWGLSIQDVRLPVAHADVRFVPMGSSFAVVGVKAHPAPAGEDMPIDVSLVAMRPLTTDIATSVRLMDSSGTWIARHDMQPALGAVPSLKWIRGSRVADRHILAIPSDFSDAVTSGAMVAYERFRMVPLPAMDGRFTDVPLGIWAQP
jgi:hypothetical protein